MTVSLKELHFISFSKNGIRLCKSRYYMNIISLHFYFFLLFYNLNFLISCLILTEKERIKVELTEKDLWDLFCENETEMIVNRDGR